MSWTRKIVSIISLQINRTIPCSCRLLFGKNILHFQLVKKMWSLDFCKICISPKWPTIINRSSSSAPPLTFWSVSAESWNWNSSQNNWSNKITLHRTSKICSKWGRIPCLQILQMLYSDWRFVEMWNSCVEENDVPRKHSSELANLYRRNRWVLAPEAVWHTQRRSENVQNRN